MSSVKVTPSMRNAMAVLNIGPAHYSNATSVDVQSGNGAALGRTVYWQAADKLADLGLVAVDRETVTLTDAGRAWLAEYHP